MIFINEANDTYEDNNTYKLVTIYEAKQLSRDACLTYFSYKNVLIVYDRKRKFIQYYN